MSDNRQGLQVPKWKSRRRKVRRITAFLLLAVLGTSYFLFDRETEVLDENARRSAPGHFLHLPDGAVHYEISGPADGEPVILIHGGSIPYFVWDRNVPALAQAGFRTIRYDLYGRGFSDRPDTTYDQNLYDRQLLSLLDALHISKKVHLVGLSMGGGIAGGFTDKYSGRVNKLALIDPVGFAVNLPAVSKLMYVPGLGEYLFRIVGYWTLSGSFIRNDFFSPANCPDSFLQAYRSQMKYEGFQRALLSTLRNMPLDDMEDIFQRVGRTDRPILILWGKEDKTTPYAASGRARLAMPRARLIAIEEAGHLPGVERPDAVNAILVDFLSGKTSMQLE